jgi:hypothetical protein
MKNKLYKVTYRNTPSSEIITRKVYAYSEHTIKNMLVYEGDITKNQLTIIKIELCTTQP